MKMRFFGPAHRLRVSGGGSVCNIVEGGSYVARGVKRSIGRVNALYLQSGDQIAYRLGNESNDIWCFVLRTVSVVKGHLRSSDDQSQENSQL